MFSPKVFLLEIAFFDHFFSVRVDLVWSSYSKGKGQSVKVANPVRGQLNKENEYFPPFAPGIWSREMVSAVSSRVTPLISIFRLNLVLAYGIPPEFRGGVHLLI